MNEELENIHESLARLERAVARIENGLNRTHKSCANMDNHISFIEGVYSSVRQPLSFIAQRFRGARPLPNVQQCINDGESIATHTLPIQHVQATEDLNAIE